MRKSPITWLLLLSLILGGFALRLYHLDRFSYRGDEAFTMLNWVRPAILETLNSDIILNDPQPALAYISYWGWGQVFGEGELVMRLLPVLMNTLGIAAIFALGRHVNGAKTGLLAALMWAMHPFLIWHAQDIRTYAIWSSLSALSLWLALLALKRRRWVDWVLFVLAAVLSAYFYYLEVFMFVALNIYVFSHYWRDRQLLKAWVFSQVAIGLLLAPWFLQERLLFGSGYGGTVTTPFSLSALLTEFLPTLSFGETLPIPYPELTGALILLVILAGLWALWRINRPYARLFALILVVNFGLLSLVSLKLNVFTPRYILCIIPVMMIAFARLIRTIYHLRPALIARSAALALLGIWLGLSLISQHNHHFAPEYAKPDWRSITDYLHARIHPDDVVIAGSSDVAFIYYYDNFTEIRYLPASERQDPEEIRETLAETTDAFVNLWVLDRPNPTWPNAEIRTAWLETHAQALHHASVDGFPVTLYRGQAIHPFEEADQPLGQRFEGVATLLGVEIIRPILTDEALSVIAYWQTENITKTPLKGFVHLMDADQTQVIRQDDHELRVNGQTTQNWPYWPEWVQFRDVYTLSLEGVAPGEYVLIMGLYDPETGARVPLENGDTHTEIGPFNWP
jgi:hypothetical protein